jgi:LCP family protein required for cell wall assembly
VLSATAGALLAVSLSSTPLLQSQLTPEEEQVFNQDESIASNSALRLPKLTRPVNILILGIKVLSTEVDNPPPETRNLGYHALVNSFEGLSDTMLLVRFDPRTEKMTVLSIPRDTRTWVDGAGTTKINEANYYGGPALSARSISEMLGGVPIDRYVRINVQGVEKLVDALGGVTVNVPKDMRYQDDSQHLYINLEAGEQELDGDKAMQFLRFRYDEYGDVGRVQRQQMLMRALVEQTLNPKTIARMPKILSVIQSHVDTNLSVEELVALTGFASQIDRTDTQMILLPGDFSDPIQYDLSYWMPDYQRIDEIVDQYFRYGAQTRSVAVSPSYLRIAVQNSTYSAAAVDRVIDELYEGGYRNIEVVEPWREPLEVTRIIAQQGDIESAEMVHRYLGFGEVRVESTGALQSDITIQLGEDWLEQQPDLQQDPRYLGIFPPVQRPLR